MEKRENEEQVPQNNEGRELWTDANKANLSDKLHDIKTEKKEEDEEKENE